RRRCRRWPDPMCNAPRARSTPWHLRGRVGTTIRSQWLLVCQGAHPARATAFAPIFTACRAQTRSLAEVWLHPAEARKHFGENGIDGYIHLLAGRPVSPTDPGGLGDQVR